MRKTRLLFRQSGLLLALPVDLIQRVQEAAPVVSLPGAAAPVLGLAACGGCSRVVLNLARLLPVGGGVDASALTDQPPLWVLLEGEAEGLSLEIPAPLSFSGPLEAAPRPAAATTVCDRGERHGTGIAGLLSGRRLLALCRRSLGPLAASGPFGAATR